jgi:hypothetical protein
MAITRTGDENRAGVFSSAPHCVTPPSDHLVQRLFDRHGHNPVCPEDSVIFVQQVYCNIRRYFEDVREKIQ